MRQNYRLELKTILNEETASGAVEIIDVDNCMGFCAVFYKSDSSPTNKTFTTVSLDALSVSAHGYKTGLKVRFTTSGVLPTGLSAGVDYYLIAVSANTLMVAATQEDADNGVYQAVSGGSGTHTINVQAFEPCYIKIDGSIDDTVWFNISTQQIGDTAQRIEHEAAFCSKIKVTIEQASGQRQIYSKIMTKGF